jgi:phage terminase large subunit
MKDIDLEYYNHHVLGQWQDGILGRIFTDWQIGVPDPDAEVETVYALDFGFAQDPAAMVELKWHNNKLWIKELIYESGLTNQDLADRMKRIGIANNATIIADSAEPKSIEELRRLGFNIKGAYKGPDSIQSGINKIKQYQVFMHPDSSNLHQEADLYSWKPNTDKPQDQWNHLMDAIRYGLSVNRSANYAFQGKTKYWEDAEGEIRPLKRRRMY